MPAFTEEKHYRSVEQFQGTFWTFHKNARKVWTYWENSLQFNKIFLKNWKPWCPIFSLLNCSKMEGHISDVASKKQWQVRWLNFRQIRQDGNSGVDQCSGEEGCYTCGNVYLVGESITVEVVGAYWSHKMTDDPASSFQSNGSSDSSDLPSRYEILVKHGPFSWMVSRTSQDLLSLDRELMSYRVRPRLRYFW